VNSYAAAETSSEDEDDTNFFKKSSYHLFAKHIKFKPVNNLSDCSVSNSKVSNDSHYSSRDRKRGFFVNLLIDSDDESVNSDTDNNTTSNLMLKDNDNNKGYFSA
jgi:hypothetical protein